MSKEREAPNDHLAGHYHKRKYKEVSHKDNHCFMNFNIK